MALKNKLTWLAIVVLITVEQGIKVVINNNFLNEKFPILPPILYFAPMFNRDYSWFNSMFQLGIGKWIHVSIVAIMGVLIYLFNKYLNKQLVTNKTIEIMYAFLLSGAVCSLIDKVFWDGSLDYILLNGYFTFDLKDIYINIFIGLVILSLLFNRNVFDHIDDNITKDFINYIVRSIRLRGK